MTKVKCQHCGKELSSQGLAGHIRLKHGIKAETKYDSRNSSAESHDLSAESQENLAESQEILADSQKLFTDTRELLDNQNQIIAEQYENLTEARENREIRELSQFEIDLIQKDPRIKITKDGLSYPAGYEFHKTKLEDENSVSSGEQEEPEEEFNQLSLVCTLGFLICLIAKKFG